MIRNIIIFDFEVYKFNTLLGALILANDGNVAAFQSWNLSEIKEFYRAHIDDIWVGHNNKHYDNFILQAIVNGRNEQQIRRVNDQIIRENKKLKLTIPLIFYDLTISHWCALKQMEAYVGKNISETEVDFMIDRELTEEEKRSVESYNLDDLDQTMDDFFYLQHEFLLRMDVINEFHLPMSCLNVTGTQLAEEVLHATKVEGISKWIRKPVLWPTLRVKNQEVIDFYMSESWSWTLDKKDRKTLDVMLCGCNHRLASGGIHAAQDNMHLDWAYYFDVSGYYNLIMILLDLLPRSIPPEYRKEYENMYHKQLELKKTDPGKRGVYKTILLSVFGAMNNEGCRFYDPYNGDLVRMSGQMYLVDLLEKCEGKLEVVQSNTDGVILIPINGTTEEEVMAIMKEWIDRTGFVLKLDKIYDIHQRDVNTYCYRDASGEIHVVGDTITHYGKMDFPFWKDSYNAKEPLIVSYAMVEYFMNKKLPEEYIYENMRNLRMFQYICKKLSFDWLEYEETDLNTGDTSVQSIQHINRAFALKSDICSGMIFKCKHVGKVTRAKVANLPNSVFVHNDEILSEKTIDELVNKIDYQYYIDRAYEKIQAFYNIMQIKEIHI